MHDAPLMLCAGEALTDLLHQGEDRWLSREGGSVVVDAVALCRLLSGRRDEVRPVHAGPDAGLLERLRAVRVLF